MTGLRYSPLHVTEFCGEMQGKFRVGLARLKSKFNLPGKIKQIKAVKIHTGCLHQ